jgi:LuxR family maltose regulon positive regulatory protein
MATEQRWLSTLGPATVEASPPLAILAGWMAVYAGQPAQAERWAAFVDTAAYVLRPVDGTASFESGRAMLRAAMCPNGPDQMASDAELAAELEPAWSDWRATALALCAEAQLLRGDADRATALFVETSATATALGNVNAVVLSQSELAVLAMDRGRWSEAGDRLQLALTTIDEKRLQDYILSVLAFAAAARFAAHEGDRKDMDRHLARAMRARPSCTSAFPHVSVRVRLQLAKVYAAVADQVTARHLFREIDDILLDRPALGVLVDEVTRSRGILTRSTEAALTRGPPLTSAELRLLPYLQTHLTFREIGERLFISRNTISSEVSSIYRKLGVSSRSEAVKQATEIGLLGD